MSNTFEVEVPAEPAFGSVVLDKDGTAWQRKDPGSGYMNRSWASVRTYDA